MGISGPRYLGPVLEGVVWTLLSISTLVFALRMYCRKFLVRSIGSDDWIMMVALGVLWGIGVINHIQVETGTGTSMDDLPKPDRSAGPPSPEAMAKFQASFRKTLQAWYTYQLMYLIALFFVKISILAFYRRLSPKKSYQYSIWGVAGVVTVYTIVMVFVNAFECDTPSDAWNPATWPKGCHDLNPIYYGQAAFNIVSDIVILILPIPTLLSLQVNKTKRVMLLLIFSVGSVSVIASIVRINALYIWHHSMNKPYDGAWILLWSQVEMNAAVISASAPALKPLVASIVGGTGFFTSRYGARSTQGYTQQSAKGGVALRSYNGASEKEVGNGTTMTTEIRGKGSCSESEENIVVGGGADGFGSNGGIYRTTEVAVDVESQRERRY